MREERGNIQGDVVIEEVYTLWGMIIGNVSVLDGGKFYLRGSVYGNLVIEPGGKAHIWGNVQGNLLIMDMTKVIHSGTVGGDVVNNGGRLYVDKLAKIGGKMNHKKGYTHFDSHKSLVQGKDAFGRG